MYPVPQSVTVPQHFPQAAVPWQCCLLGTRVLSVWLYPGGCCRSLNPGTTEVQPTPCTSTRTGRLYPAPVPLAMHMFLVSLYPSRAAVSSQSTCTLARCLLCESTSSGCQYSGDASVCLCPGSAPMQLFSSRVAMP